MTPTLLLALIAPPPAAAQDTPLDRQGTLYGAWPGADFGAVIAPAGDVDGDGFPDLAVAAPYDDAEGSNRGRVVVYLAQRDGSGYAGESWSVTGSVDRGHYGGVLAGGHDLDGDTYDDLVVAASFQDRRVDVYRGGELGLETSPSWTQTAGGGAYGWAVAVLGDMNGDGFSDLAIGDALAGDAGEVHLHLGSADGPAEEPLVLRGDSDHPVGAVLDAAGDVDGDGLDDLLAAPSVELTVGAAAIFAGADADISFAPAYHLSRPADAPGFGASATGAGDIDGDGYDDVAVGADGLGEDDATGDGRALLWRGGSTGPGGQPDQALSDSSDDSLFGRSLDGAGDVDGDGFADLVVGRPGWSSGELGEGGAVLFVGSAEGLVEDAAWRVESDVAAEDRDGVWIGLGTAVAGIGDADLDGYDDVAVGLQNVGGSNYDARLGEVWVYGGQAWTPAEPPDDDSGDPVDTGDAPVDEGGCGCGAGSAASVAFLPLLVLLVGRRRR